MHAQFEHNVRRLYDTDTALAVALRLHGPQSGHQPISLGPLPEAGELVVGGIAFDSAVPWLEADNRRRAYFIEPDHLRLCALLSSEEGTRLLSHPRASLHTTLPDVGMDVVVAGNHTPILLQLGARLRWQREDRTLVRNNLHANLRDLPDSRRATDLWGRFTGIPAVICGAGPSLDAAIPAVNALRDRALVFAGGSALRAGTLRPHLGAAIDPVAPLHARVPLFFRHRTAPGARGYYVSGASGYPVVERLDACLGLPDSGVDEGVSVTCFLLSIAKKLGCSPLFLVGVDLSLVAGRAYAKSVGCEGDEKGAQWALERAWIEQNAEVAWGVPAHLPTLRTPMDFSARRCPEVGAACELLRQIEQCEHRMRTVSGMAEALIAEVELACLMTA